ncbi:MAG TPA: trehalose-phosphatase [Longimicrobiaceae bacterium]|nr:trehalose-phosphatase [Longimicrobiaceae bacterium]
MSIVRSDQDLPHASTRVDSWRDAWRRTGRMVVILDFDGTLAPIVDRPEQADIPPGTRTVLDRILNASGVSVAIVSGRGMADARSVARLDGIVYAGNHGMEIGGPGIEKTHEKAAAARPALASVVESLEKKLANVEGAWVEDKGLTLSIHYRQVDRSQIDEVRRAVAESVATEVDLRITEGKEVVEVRPAVDWHKGRAVDFLLAHISPPAGTPAIYIGDDTTDEDAFAAIAEWPGGRGEGVLVGDPASASTSAKSFVRDPAEVAALLRSLAKEEPEQPVSS